MTFPNAKRANALLSHVCVSSLMAEESIRSRAVRGVVDYVRLPLRPRIPIGIRTGEPLQKPTTGQPDPTRDPVPSWQRGTLAAVVDHLKTLTLSSSTSGRSFVGGDS